MNAKLTGSGIVYDNLSENRRSLCFPRLCVLNDRWLCVFRSAYKKEQSRGQETLLTWSDDEGKSFSEPISPFKPLEFEKKPGVFREAGISVINNNELLASLWWVDQSDPDLPLFNWDTEGLLGSKLFISRSYDKGQTWTKPEHVPTGPFTKATPIDSHIIVTKDKLAYPFEQYKNYYEEGEWRHYSAMMLSEDGGLTWNSHVITAHDPEGRMFYWDQRPCVVSENEIFVVFDTFEKGSNARANMHARVSSGNLSQWSDLWDIGVAGQPGYPLQLPDGRISLVYNDRGDDPGIKLRVSSDMGKSFPESTCILVHSPRNLHKQLAKRADLKDVMLELNTAAVFGYPSQRLLPDGDILITYYAGDDADCTNIRWARIKI
jgi:hypothetical protein